MTEEEDGLLIANVICEILNRQQHGDPEAARTVQELQDNVRLGLRRCAGPDVAFLTDFNDALTRHINAHLEQRCKTQAFDRIN